jgi:DNA polymerase-3 subunit delta'
MSAVLNSADAAVPPLLARSLERGRLAHAYLLTGDELAGLEAVARALARIVNCLRPGRRSPDEAPLAACGQCASCRQIAGDAHPDIHWVRAESKLRVITIDQVRELMRQVQMKPTSAAYKVGVIVAADRLNTQAANAFLKTLEEPPAKSILILLTTEPQQLLETVLSRCLRLNLGTEAAGRLSDETRSCLRVFVELAAAEPKGLLDRYRLLSALLGRLAQMKDEIEKRLTTASPLERYEDVDPKLRDRWEDELAAAVEAEYRRQREGSLVALEWWLRDVWLLTLGLGEDLLGYSELALSSRAVARRLTPVQAMENLGVLETTQRLLGGNVQEALAIEVGLLKLQL